MKTLAFSLLVTYCLSLQVGRASSEPDHLIPVDRSYDRPYFELLDRKLATTPFNYGRIIVRPPFTGEHSISIYSEATPSHGTQYHITMRTAEQSLWQASSGGVDPARAEGVMIAEKDVVITSELAELLKNALTVLVKDTRPLGNNEKPLKIVIEGPLTEVMIGRSDGKLESGQMGNFPPTTPKLGLLAKLITNLTRLCESPPSERAHLLMEVTSTADALVKKQQGEGKGVRNGK